MVTPFGGVLCERISTISVTPHKRDWQALETKISKGKSVEQAARESGIPVEEVFEYINSRLSTVDTINYQLRLVSQRALEKSVKALESLIEEGVRYGGEGSMDSVDLKAAQTLAKIAMDGIKTAQKGEAPRNRPEDNSSPDLFDLPENPWDLNDIE